MRAVLALATLALFAEAHAHRPLTPESFWRGLDARGESAKAGGVVALRTPGPARVHIAGSATKTGSTPIEFATAMRLCRGEVFGLACDDREGDATGLFLGTFRAELPAHDVILSPFWIDRTEVSVASYARCVTAGACSRPGYREGDLHFDRPEFPVTHVTWDDAKTYCAWAHGRLPTEAEWELAARGPKRRLFPWGENYNPHVVNHGAFAGDPTDATDGYAGLAPVEAFTDGATPEGVLQLAGNVAEWVADYFDVDDEGFGYTSSLSPDGAPLKNPTGPTSGLGHVVRGGSYLRGAAWQRSAARGTIPMARASDVGFRCAY